MAQRGKRVNGTENQTVICRIERRSCFCPRLYPSVKNRRQDYVCSCNMASSVAPSIFHNAGATVFQLTVLCVIGRHRLLSPDRHYNSEGRNRSVFSKKNYRREFFAGKPGGLEREDFGLRVTLIKGLSRRCRPCILSFFTHHMIFYKCEHDAICGKILNNSLRLLILEQIVSFAEHYNRDLLLTLQSESHLAKVQFS